MQGAVHDELRDTGRPVPEAHAFRLRKYSKSPSRFDIELGFIRR